MNFTKLPAASQLMRNRLLNYIMTPFDDPSTFVRESRRTPVQGVCRYKAVWHLPARRDLPHCVRHIPLRLRGGAALNKLKLKGLRPFGLFPCKALQERGSRRPCTKKAQRKALSFNLFAEREGFEPPDPLRSTVFKTAAFDHSAISPKSNVISLHVTFSVKWTAKISTFFEIASGCEEKA